jgi:hypothetical protein
MPNQTGPTRQDTWLINVQVAHPTTGNMINYGTWDKCDGGEVDSDQNQYYPGGMAPPVSLGGKKTTGNVTCSRLYRIGRDHTVIGQLLASAGSSKMIVSKTPLTLDGAVGGSPIVYSGTLKRCTPPPVDSEGTGAAIIELEMTPEGYPSA